jgi:hypothetical protein
LSGALRPWVALAALGAFHGINPAMGWLFAVALGLQRRSRAAVAWSLLPISLGHALSILTVVALVGLLRVFVDLKWLQLGGAVVLFAVAAYRMFGKHAVRVGMQVGFRDLTVWSFVMATGHGAGAMLIPVLLRLPVATSHGAHLHAVTLPAGAAPLAMGLTAITVHSLAMLATAGLVALAVYEWVGLAILRQRWINFDWLWSAALMLAGAVLVATAAGMSIA